MRLAGEAGEGISESGLREVERIFRALLVDEDAGWQWLAGRLASAPKAPVGFEGVAPGPGAAPPPSGAVSRTRPAFSSPRPVPARDVAAERRAREDERRLEAARQAEAEASAVHERALRELAGAAAVLERARGEAAAVREEFHAVQLRLEAAEKAAGAARSRRHRVEAAARKAGQAAASAIGGLRDVETGEG